MEEESSDGIGVEEHGEQTAGGLRVVEQGGGVADDAAQQGGAVGWGEGGGMTRGRKLGGTVHQGDLRGQKGRTAR